MSFSNGFKYSHLSRTVKKKYYFKGTNQFVIIDEPVRFKRKKK